MDVQKQINLWERKATHFTYKLKLQTYLSAFHLVFVYTHKSLTVNWNAKPVIKYTSPQKIIFQAMEQKKKNQQLECGETNLIP